MKNYELEINDYELTLLKYLVYERKNLLRKKHNECPETLKAGFQSAFQSANKLLHKLCKLDNKVSDIYNYDLLKRDDKSYNEYIKEYFNAKEFTSK